MYMLLRSFIDPLTIAFLLMGLSLLFAWWKHPDARRSLKWLVSAFALGWLACTGALAYMATGALEWHYPPLAEMPAEAEAIVVLSGGAHPASDFDPHTYPTCDTLRRCAAAARLYRTRRCPIVCSGGPVRDADDGLTLAQVMRQSLIEMGVAAEDILLEGGSADTHANAVNSTRLLDERGLERVVLVTDATHLYRASLCFARQGRDVIPSGAYYSAERFDGGVADFIPTAYGAQKCYSALHEVVGLVWYKLRGRI